MSRQSSSYSAEDLELLEAVWRDEGANAALASALLSALALAAAGATVSMFTGRLIRRSGLRKVVIGGGAAAATYLVKSLIGVTLD